jgi:hypothetical protein
MSSQQQSTLPRGQRQPGRQQLGRAVHFAGEAEGRSDLEAPLLSKSEK